jgi:hypothetical protein
MARVLRREQLRQADTEPELRFEQLAIRSHDV